MVVVGGPGRIVISGRQGQLLWPGLLVFWFCWACRGFSDLILLAILDWGLVLSFSFTMVISFFPRMWDRLPSLGNESGAKWRGIQIKFSPSYISSTSVVNTFAGNIILCYVLFIVIQLYIVQRMSSAFNFRVLFTICSWISILYSFNVLMGDIHCIASKAVHFPKENLALSIIQQRQNGS